MSTYRILTSLSALALVGACASEEKATPAPVVVTPPPAVVTTNPPPAVVQQPAPAVVVPAAAILRPGTGRVESMAALPPSAAAGGTAGAPMRRVGVKMEDGTLQFIDTSAPGLEIGDRVELTPQGTIRHPVP